MYRAFSTAAMYTEKQAREWTLDMQLQKQSMIKDGVDRLHVSPLV